MGQLGARLGKAQTSAAHKDVNTDSFPTVNLDRVLKNRNVFHDAGGQNDQNLQSSCGAEQKDYGVSRLIKQ